MNILVLNHYAGSRLHGMEYRSYYLAREWEAVGHRTRIVAASFSHLRAKQPGTDGAIRREMIDGVEYLWVPTRPYQGNGIGRVGNMFGFVTTVLRRSAEITDGFPPDAIVTSSTYMFDVVAAHFIGRRYGAKLVHEVRDLWPLSLVVLGNMPRWHPLIVMFSVAERFAYRRADKVVSALPHAEGHMRAHGLATGKFVYVPNGIDVSEWKSLAAPLPAATGGAIADFRRTHEFLVGYAGGHGLSNALECLLEAAALLKDEHVGVVFVGHGPEKPRLEATAAERGLTNVLFLPPVAKTAVPAFLAEMDALYIGSKRHDELYKFGVSPNKLMDYMMAEKPVIQAFSAGNDIVRESGCGLSVSPGDARAIADAARRLRAESAEARHQMGRRGKEYVLTHHSYDVLSKQFLEVLSN